MESIRAFYEVPKKNSAPDDAGIENILMFLQPKENASLLDIGCFEGIKTEIIKNHLNAQETVGVDFLKEKLHEAESRGIRTVWADLNTGKPLDLPNEAFDVIICSEVIEHVYSPDDLLDEISRLLKPDGYVILTTPNLASWKNRIALLLGWQPFLSEVSTRDRYGNPFVAHGRPSGHIRLFTLRALLEMTRAHGLQTKRIGGIRLSSPQKNLMGILSRTTDGLLANFPSLCDRFILRMTKQ
jgi:2-polyprenyl-3-methyl-5-hydroxy-6-metoxy-1,4-benzoquinol methylase